MANLKKFINSNIRPNVQLDLYLNRFPKIGKAVPNVVENLRLKLTGDINVLGFEFKNKTVEILMENEAPHGECTLIFDGTRMEKVPYHTNGNDLKIMPKTGDLSEVILRPGDREWSWIGVKGKGIFAWIGTWPAGKAVEEKDLESFPQEYVEQLS